MQNLVFTDLSTPRLILTGISIDDLDFIYTQFSNEEVNRYLFDAEPVSLLTDAEEIIRFYLTPEPRNQHRWILVSKDDGAKLGTCGFHCWDRDLGSCQIGYDLIPHYWGQGYMNEAVSTLLIYAREEMKVTQIDAIIYPENVASIRLAEKNGFVHYGVTSILNFRGEGYLHKIYSWYP